MGQMVKLFLRGHLLQPSQTLSRYLSTNLNLYLLIRSTKKIYRGDFWAKLLFVSNAKDSSWLRLRWFHLLVHFSNYTTKNTQAVFKIKFPKFHFHFAEPVFRQKIFFASWKKWMLNCFPRDGFFDFENGGHGNRTNFRFLENC